MSWAQKIMKAVFPRSWAEAAEVESRSWMMCCPCGREVSVWDMGGIRFKAAGNPRVWIRCPKCGMTWHRLHRVDSATSTSAEMEPASSSGS